MLLSASTCVWLAGSKSSAALKATIIGSTVTLRAKGSSAPPKLGNTFVNQTISQDGLISSLAPYLRSKGMAVPLPSLHCFTSVWLKWPVMPVTSSTKTKRAPFMAATPSSGSAALLLSLPSKYFAF